MTFDRLRQIVRLRLAFALLRRRPSTTNSMKSCATTSSGRSRQISCRHDAGRSATRRAGGDRRRAANRRTVPRSTRRPRRTKSAAADTRYAFRVLRRSPVFALVAIASLALGIGAFLAIFQLVDAIRLRTLPVEAPHELVEIRIDGGRGGWGLSDTAAEITLPLMGTDPRATNRASRRVRVGEDRHSDGDGR